MSPGLAAIPSLAQPCWAVLELPGASRAGRDGNAAGTGRARSGCCVCPLQHSRCSAEHKACFSRRDMSTGDSVGTNCPKNRLLACLLCVSTRGLGTHGYRVTGTEQGCSSSLLHGAALPRNVALLGPRALGTARPALALQDTPRVPAVVPALCPVAVCRRSVSAGIRAVSSKRAHSEPEAQGGSARLSPGATALATQTKPSRSAEPFGRRQEPKSAFQFPNLATCNLTLNFSVFGWQVTKRAGGSCPGAHSGCRAGGLPGGADALPHPCLATHARIAKKGEKRAEIMLVLLVCSFQEDSCCLLPVVLQGPWEMCCPQ